MPKTAEILDTLIHSQSLNKYKKIGSKASLPNRVVAEKKEVNNRMGALFLVRKKEHFDIEGATMGYIVTSKETLLEDAGKVSHFTPNLYRTFNYVDDKRKFISGFTEENLLCLHSFSFELDHKNISVEEIVMTCYDESVGVPTMIVETPRGYQLHFVLNAPFYMSDKKHFLTLTIAKRIAKNIRESLASLNIDLYCNDFGFFRVPTSDNTVFYRPEATQCLKDLIMFSERADNDKGHSLFLVASNNNELTLTKSEWFNALVNSTNVNGNKTAIGRNNLLFTLALACFADGWPIERTHNLLDQCNTNFKVSLKQIKSILKSAYSGSYKAPSHEYISQLLDLYCGGAENYNLSFGATKGWYKHKKERKDRKRSHFKEWEEDIVAFVNSNTNVDNPFLDMSQNTLCQALDMPRSSLNVVLKETSILLKRVKGTGKNAVTSFTTVRMLIQSIIKKKKDAQNFFAEAIQNEIEVIYTNLLKNPASEKLIDFFKNTNKTSNDNKLVRLRSG